MSHFTLKYLLNSQIAIDPAIDCKITGLSPDSRDIQPGDVFVALRGGQHDGRTFMQQAVEKGAVAILIASENTTVGWSEFVSPQGAVVPLVKIPQLETKLGEIAAVFYGHPSQSLTVIGVTGTNGKTSCTQWLGQILENYGIACGVMGTLGYGRWGQLNPGEYTTPMPIALQRILADLQRDQVKAVAMEVSSHALAQARVSGIDFDTAIFTNLTHDHLDYHGTLADYASAKERLFAYSSVKHAVFNLDDPYGKAWFFKYASQKKCYGYTLEAKNQLVYAKDALIYAQQITLSAQGMGASVTTPWGEGTIHSPLLGRFNLSNLLAVITGLCIFGIPLSFVLEAVSALKSPPGRMQVKGGGHCPTIVIDYAHTPDALRQVLMSLREHCVGKLWCVFGCGGNRDKTKRPLMGNIAQAGADYLVITDDNPRHEAAKAIIADIVAQLPKDSNRMIEPDRHKAIQHAIRCAAPEDMILIAGKGHECYQQIGDEKIPFSDAIEVELALHQR